MTARSASPLGPGSRRVAGPAGRRRPRGRVAPAAGRCRTASPPTDAPRRSAQLPSVPRAASCSADRPRGSSLRPRDDAVARRALTRCRDAFEPRRLVAQCGPPEPAQRPALPRRTPCSGTPCRPSSPSPCCGGSASTRGASAAAWTAISSPRCSPRSSVSWSWRRSRSRSSRMTSDRSRASGSRSTGASPRSSARATRRYVTSPGGCIIGWLLILFGVAIVGTITGALVGFVIDFLLKEGQGMGASGYRGPHRRLRLEQHRPRPDRGAQGRRLPAQDRRHPRPPTRTPPATASTSSAATRPTPTTSSAPGIAEAIGGGGLPGRRLATRPTCARS